MVIVFVKAPAPGTVKTRLIGPLSAEQATAVYRSCLDVTLTILRDLTGPHIVAAVTPDDGDFGGIIPDYVQIIPQGPGDLGSRLSRVVDWASSQGFGPVVIVGSDCPLLKANDVQSAFEALTRQDVVIGPAADGGYYLIGLSRPAPAVFAGIDWSTGRVGQQTMGAAADAGLSIAKLRVLRDLDELADLRAAVAELDEANGLDDARKRFRTAMAEILREVDRR